MNDLAECARRAIAAAACVIQNPILFAVLADLADRTEGVRSVGFHFGFLSERHGWLGKSKLDVCFIKVEPKSPAGRVVSSGTYEAEQFSQLASIPGFSFPWPSMELTAVERASRVQSVLEVLRATAAGGERLQAKHVSLRLSTYEGQVAWHAVHDVPGIGVRTLILDAMGPEVLFEKFDEQACLQP